MLSRRYFIAKAALTATSVLSLAACGAFSNKDSSTKDVPLVLTTFTVLQDIAQNIAGDYLKVESITKAGAEIHDYEPTPEDITRSLGASLVLNNGLGLERWFEQFMADSNAERVVVSEGVEPIPIAEGDYAGNANPHAWMSPKNVMIYVDNIVAAFSKLDSAHAEAFAKNGQDYKDQLEAIYEQMMSALEGLPDSAKTLVTCEGAFSYLCRDAELEEAYLWPVNAENEGTPQQIAHVVSVVKEKQVPCVFCESTVSPKAMQQVADECHVRFLSDSEHMLYVDSLSGANGLVPTFIDLLSHDVEVIISGLGDDSNA